MTWNDTDGTVDIGMKGGNVTLQVGQEQLVRVVNKSGVNLLESTYGAVKILGSQGNRLSVKLAQADSDDNSAETLGLATENIDNNQEGFVTANGLVRNINTTGALQGELWNDGDVLYLSPTVAGRITNIKPQAPQHTVIVGYVIRAHANVGSIFVKVDNGYEIDELHNVRINTGSLGYGDLLMRSGSVWANTKNLSGSYQLTGSLDISGSQTINGNQIISGSITITQNISVLGTSSFVYVTSSNLNLTGPYIYTNIFEPIERFGGLVVFDSGSDSHLATASLLWDSLNNHWIYQNASGSSYSGGMLLSGPRNTGSLGDEIGLTSTRIPKSVGGDHLDNSNIYDDGSKVKIISNTEITGSLKVTGGISGSIDFSYIQNVPSLVSGSSQINITGTTGYSTVSSSIATALNGAWRLTDGIVSEDITFNETVTLQEGANMNVTLLPGTNTVLFESLHPSVSAAGSSNNSGRTYIQDILLDVFGHITGITTATETVTDTHTTGVTFNTGDGVLTFTKNNGNTYTVDLDGRYGTSSSDNYVTGGTFNTGTGNLRLTRNDGGTIDVDLDGRYLESHPSVSAASSSDNSGRTYIQDILLDSFGHITGITTATETVINTDTYTTGGTTNSTTGLITFTKSDGNTYTTSISGYVSTQIANLVDSAPTTLDTLNELAAALGDDPNFATTISTAIGNKVSKSGDTMTGNLTAPKFITSGGTSSQFVKGDGTLDSSTYLTSYSETDTLTTVTARGSSTATPVTFNGNVTLGNSADLIFRDVSGTFPTSGKGFDWELNNDGARIYAIQPSSDSIDLVFQLRDNATTNDRFVFWVDDYQGPAFDKYPLIIRGGTEFDLVNSALYVGGTLVLSNGRVLQNVTGNISMFTNDSGYLTAHPSVTAASSSNNSGRTYIQDILLDSFGHITGITTASETVTDTFTTGATFNTSNGVITFTNNNGGGTFTVDIDGRFLTSYTETQTLQDVTDLGSTTTRDITARSFIVTGANSSQFLKGDGSLDSNTYLTAHPSVSAASSSNNSGRTYIQDILLDSFGHITGITTATETVTDTNNYTTGVTFNTGDGVLTFTRNDGGTYTVDLDGRYGTSSTDYYTTGATFNTSNGVITYTRNDGGTYTVDIDGRFLTSYSEISTLEDVVQRGNISTISITAASFVTQGGNSGQFVKGDGTLDSNTYLTSHPSVSAASSSNNSGRTYIQDILLDSFGHITGITTASETVTDTNYYVTGATFNTGNGIVTLTRNDGGTITVDLDGKYLDSSSYTASDVLSKLLTVDGASSGLDADLLDGQQGSYYYPASNPSGYISSYLNYFTTGATFNTSNGVITFSRNDGNTYTVDIDGRFSTTDHTHDDRYLPYVKNTETSGLASGQWYTIAVNAGNRASGKFILRDTSSGNHQSVVFYATHHFGSYSDITVLINSRYSGNPFRYIRIQDGGTYDGALLQVYIDQDSSTVQAWMLENIQSNGWVIKDWVDSGTDPGDVANFPALTTTPAQVDLDNAPQGGIITTGPVYGGGDTTQYEYLNTNNYSTTTDTRYYTETEIGNFFGGSSAITGYNKSNWDTAFGWGNHGTQGYATTGYVQTQITNLIDGAPAALDTLNELAAALGDDPNFATTFAGAIGAKLPLSGGTMTGNIAFGATSNLGLTWGLNTDAAFIKFISTSNAAGGSYLEIGTQDDSDEEIKFTQSGNLRFYLATDGFLRNGAGYKYVFENGTWGINISGNASTVTDGVYTTGTYSNPAWITALAGSKITGNISGNASNITSYTINQDLGTSNSPTFSSVTATAYNTTYSPLRDKFRLWGTSSEYAIGMMNGMTYGGLNDYAMTFQFNNEDDRGFWWGDTVHSDAQGAMALTTNGYLTVARGVRVGYGESDTVTPNVPLQVYGSGSLVFDVQGSQGQLFSVTDSLSGSLFSVNDISGLPILEVFSDDRVVMGSFGMNSLVVSGTTTTVSGSFAVSGSATINGGTVWHSGNDGSGSGLDADTLDGYHASSFLTSYSETDTLASVTARGASTSTQSVFTGGLNARKNQTDNNYTTAALTTESFGNTTTGVAFHISGVVGKFLEMRTDGVLYWDNSKVWTAGTDGSGSGLDADTLDGYHASSFLTAHPSVSAASSSNNSGRTYIQDILLDSFGHITGITTATETVTDTNDYISNVQLAGSTLEFTAVGSAFGGSIDLASINTDTNYYTTSASFNTSNGIITFSRNDGGTYTVDIDGKYQESGTYLGAISYNNDSNSNYQLLWGSGNAVYGTAGVYVNPSSDYVYAQSFNAGDWFRSSAATGWYNSTYGGGIYQTESTMVRVYDNRGFWIDGGNTNTVNDATLYVTATNNNDWLAQFNAYNSSKSEYGIYVNIASSATYGYALRTDSSSFTYRVDGSGRVYAPIYYDINDTNYYVNPASTSNLATVKLNSTASGTEVFTIDGVNGRLFTITDDLSNSLFSVNTIAGVPVIEVFADNKVIMGRYNQNDLHISSTGEIGMGNTSVSGFKLAVTGNLRATSFVRTGGSSSQFLMADGSVSTNPGWITSYSETDTLDSVLARGASTTRTAEFYQTSNTLINTVAPTNRGLTVFQDTAGTDAYMTFHISGDYAGYFGLGGAENDLVWGGWSLGNVRNRIWHSGNDGSGSGLDADTLDGQHASAFLTGHPSVSAAGSSNNSGRTYIQDILLDSFGHITGITTATETVVDTDTNYYVTSASFNTSNGVITLTRNDGGTVTVDIDGKYAESSHTHDDRYFTETESDARFQPLENQRLSTSNNVTFNQVYTNNWFRNNATNTGLYNEVTTMHLSSQANGYWDVSSTNTESAFRFYTGGHVSAIRGYVYANSSNQIGFLNSGGNWGLRMDNSYNVQIFGELTANNAVRSPIYYDSADSNYFLNPNGYSNLGTVRFNSSGANAEVVAVDGVNGRLFTVTDDMTDSIFSVNTISGLPVIEAFADYSVVMGRYGLNDLKIDNAGAVTIRGNTVWHAGNDGSGSGLDADLLDGQHGSYYAAASSLGSYLPLGGGTMTGTITITNTDIRSNSTSNWTGDPGAQGKIQYHSARWYIVSDSGSDRIVQFRRNSTDVSYIDNSGNFIGNASTATALTSMNISQFTNNSGYITSYSETDTLASVTARGASTSTAISMSGGLTVSRDLYINGGTGGSFGNRLIVGGTSAPYTMEDGNDRPVIYSTGQYPVITLNHTVTSNTSHGPTIQLTHNTLDRQWVIGSNGTGTQLDFGYSTNTNRNPHNGIDNLNGTTYLRITNGGNMSVAANLLPWANNTYNLGSASLGWANVYTNDLHLSNMNKPEGNDIDGTSGTWTIQEGAENLYIINNLNGKKYRITLEEI
jgi:hypothetical protein